MDWDSDDVGMELCQYPTIPQVSEGDGRVITPGLGCLAVVFKPQSIQLERTRYLLLRKTTT